MENKSIRCPYCNAGIEKDSVFCPSCGKKIENQKNLSKEIVYENNTQKYMKRINFVIIIFGILSCLLLFNAGSQISSGASKMKSITSQAGNTIAEEYYNDMGKALEGFSTLCYGLGVAVLGFSVNAGVKKSFHSKG